MRSEQGGHLGRPRGVGHTVLCPGHVVKGGTELTLQQARLRHPPQLYGRGGPGQCGLQAHVLPSQPLGYSHTELSPGLRQAAQAWSIPTCRAPCSLPAHLLREVSQEPAVRSAVQACLWVNGTFLGLWSCPVQISTSSSTTGTRDPALLKQTPPSLPVSQRSMAFPAFSSLRKRLANPSCLEGVCCYW